jgi:hypothetical protein
MPAYDQGPLRVGRRAALCCVTPVSSCRLFREASLHPCRWFLSLYINSMPLIFAFRIVDCVLAMGVKVLFQIGLGEYSYTESN